MTVKDEIGHLVGKRVTVICRRYMYHGRLNAVNDQFLILEDPFVKLWGITEHVRNVPDIPTGELYITIDTIESMGLA
jgi:hypothetical protein